MSDEQKEGPYWPAPPPSPRSGYQLPPSMFKPGESFNPGGRPKGRSLSKMMALYLEMPIDDLQAIIDNPKANAKERAAARWAMQISDGFDNPRRDALDRLEGPVTQKTQLTMAGSAETLSAEKKAELARNYLANMGLTDLGLPSDKKETAKLVQAEEAAPVVDAVVPPLEPPPVIPKPVVKTPGIFERPKP